MDGRRLGILAGGGALPREIADSAARQGRPVAIVAIDSEADADFGPHPVTRINWGRIGALTRALKAHQPTDLIIVGHVRRPELWSLRPDLGFFRNLPRLLQIVASGGDDSVLRRVVQFFEGEGLRVIGPREAAPELVIGEGPIGAARPSLQDQEDIRKGLQLIRALGAYDIGQGVIVAKGRIEAIEGAEGTDRMIARVAEARASKKDKGERGGVLVKRSKPGQDLRIDMPAIGPATVENALQAGLGGIAVEAGAVLVAERAATLARADAAGVFVEGVRDRDPASPPPRYDPRRATPRLRSLGRITPRRHAVHDAAKGLATIDALSVFAAARAVVVVRNHVLAVEAGEGVEATAARAAGLRQWASITRSRRGVTVIETDNHLTPALVDAVASAGHAGIAIARGSEATDAAFSDMIAEANRRGLFVLLRERPETEQL